MKYIVVQDMKAETKVGKFIFLFDFFFLLAYAAISMMLVKMVHDSLTVPFYVFSGAVALFLTMKSPWNKKRRNWESLLLYLRKDKEVYAPEMNSGMATDNGKKKRKEAGFYD